MSGFEASLLPSTATRAMIAGDPTSGNKLFAKLPFEVYANSPFLLLLPLRELDVADLYRIRCLIWREALQSASVVIPSQKKHRSNKFIMSLWWIMCLDKFSRADESSITTLSAILCTCRLFHDDQTVYPTFYIVCHAHVIIRLMTARAMPSPPFFPSFKGR
jgi:hypothetical protein